MDIEWKLLLPLLAVLVLTILVTGPGMWSEKWGWWWMRKADRSGAGSDSARRDGSLPE
jgi:hypothetical protein